MAIIATSGFVGVGEDDLPEGSRFVTKPYRPAQIVATLRELTGGACVASTGCCPTHNAERGIRVRSLRF
jgi:hypothetical protein